MTRRSKDASPPQYDLETDVIMFSLKICHGGVMHHEPKHYIGGKIDYYDWVDGEMFGMSDLMDFLDELGYQFENVKMWHETDFRGFRVVETDMDAIGLLRSIPTKKEVRICLEHLNPNSNSNPNPTSKPNLNPSLSSDSDSDEYYESEYDMEEDDNDFDKFVDSGIELDGGVGKGKGIANKYVSEKVFSMMEQDCDKDVSDSDDFESVYGSDEEVDKKFPKYNPKADKDEDVELKLETMFSSKKEVKDVIETFCLRKGMCIKFDRNDSRRLRAVCRKNECDWYAYASPMQNDKTWLLKGYNPNHKNRAWNYNNPSLKSGWMGKTFMKKFRTNPKLGTKEFRGELSATLKASISKQQAYRAKKKAKELLDGTLKQQFQQIRDCCLELLRANPGSTVVLKLSDVESGQPVFQRLYICFEACKKGFRFCRKIVGVDECFLKGPQGGQLLTAVGIDPNNQMFPIAYAVVENETKDSWTWFLSLLKSDIGIENQFAWTFMSDKHKGLIPAFEDLFPHSSNRFCVRHLHTNMKRDGFTGQSVKNALWAAARATRVEVFKARMEQLRDLDESAYEWLINKPPSQWSRSHFTTDPKCDILLNNMCESFNDFILDARDKPIINMLETVRHLFMTRLQVNRDKAMNWDGRLCPRIKQLLDKNAKDGVDGIPIKSDEWHFEITGPFDQHNVDVAQHVCSCRRWELTGIPCKHACLAIWCRKEDPTAYVNEYYSVKTYSQVYEAAIMGITRSELWPNCDLPAPLPPSYENRSGRPKKMRRRHPDEPPSSSSNLIKLKKFQKSLKCGQCGKVGHNSRTCQKRNANANQNVDYVSQPTPSHVDDISLSGPEPVFGGITENTQPESTQISVSKLPIKRKRGSSSVTVGVNVGGNTNNISSLHVNQSSNVSTPIIVRGGVNYITLANLRNAVGTSSTIQGKSKGKEKI